VLCCKQLYPQDIRILQRGTLVRRNGVNRCLFCDSADELSSKYLLLIRW